MPVQNPIPKRPRGLKSTLAIPATIIEDVCVFNLQALMVCLGLTEESTKKWCSRHGVGALTQGKTWIFTGESFRRDLQCFEQSRRGEQAD